ncbi:MAG: hypothetical protein LUE92_11320 [Clostridiales bacterium]|nr:hypothetical protein [Clostridiales bacterium]
MILENKRHLCLLALAWLFGIILYCRKEDVWLALLAILGAVILYGLLTGTSRKEAVVMACLAAAAACTAFCFCFRQDVSYTRIQESFCFGADAEITGTVYQKQFRSDGCLYYLKTDVKKSSCLLRFGRDFHRFFSNRARGGGGFSPCGK